MKLKIWSDRSFLPADFEHAEILIPFWGKNHEDSNAPHAGLFDQYMHLGHEFFEMASLEQADLAIMPGKWEQVMLNSEARTLASEFAEQARQSGKQMVIFFWSDYNEDLDIADVIMFRTSLYRSKKKSSEFAMPAWSEDFVMKYMNGKVPIRPKSPKPRVGFCGFAEAITPQLLIKNHIKKILHFIGINKGEIRPPLRGKALKILAKDNRIDTNFIIRKSFLGGALNKDGTMNPIIMNKTRQEYLKNLRESDYILCVRGAGNYSYRLYETLCCGKIPVFLDTDCVLPYDFEIDWQKYCVWVDIKELPFIAEKIVEFHDARSPKDFLELQYQCRQLWEQRLSPEGFFSNLYRHF